MTGSSPPAIVCVSRSWEGARGRQAPEPHSLRRMRRQKKLERLFDSATSAVAQVLGIGFILAVCLNFSNVIGRYFFGQVMLGADELQSFILIIMTVMGAAVVTWRGGHITVSVIVDLVPGRVGRVIAIGANVVLAAVALLVAWQAWKVSFSMYGMGRVSDAAAMPMWIIHGLVTISFTMIAVFAAYKALGGKHQGPPEEADSERTAP